MFAGIIEGVGIVIGLSGSGVASGNRRLEIDLGEFAVGLTLGASVAVNGVCLTLAAVSGSVGGFDVVPETLRLTNLGDLRRGDSVNIERSLRVGDRIDGHFVQGHVEGIGTIIANGMKSGEWIIRVQSPPELMRYIVRKGSITIDGTSLTLVDVERGQFSVALIPTTLQRTVLGKRNAGDLVNLETDVLARLVISRLDTLLNADEASPSRRGVTLAQLRESGFAT